jgi:hypothetical protein
MKVEDLKSMSSLEVKNFIRQRLMYSEDEINFIVNEVNDPICIDLLDNIRPNLTLHKRYNMSGDVNNEDLLSYFDDLNLKNDINPFVLWFHKGCADFDYYCNNVNGIVNENFFGYGTIDIIYEIMNIAWGLKQDQ